VTLTADAKKRVTIPGASPGDVFTVEKTDNTVILRRIYRQASKKKLSRKQAQNVIRTWKALRGVKWEELRAVTREP
jgi:hypothetical protein